MAEVRADQRANVDNSFGFAGAGALGNRLVGRCRGGAFPLIIYLKKGVIP